MSDDNSPKPYEYAIAAIPADPSVVDILNSYGADGWILVTTTARYAILMRPMMSPAPPTKDYTSMSQGLVGTPTEGG